MTEGGAVGEDRLAAYGDLRSLGAEMPHLIERARGEAESLEAQMDALARDGLLRARPFWRPGSSGQARYLYLLHPRASSGRPRREYVGRKQDRIGRVFDALARTAAFDQLHLQATALQRRAASAALHLRHAREQLLGRS